MVGRSAELAQLDAALGATAPICLAVEGEPGIGKSRLLAELRRRGEARGRVVLAGAASEFERDEPYGVWVEALDAHVAAQDLGEPELLSDLAGVLPSLGGGGTGGDERHRVHRAMRRLLTLLAERTPLVLVLDDLHWSDAASVELVGSFVRRGLAPGVLLALGYRTGRAPQALAATLAAPPVTVLELSTLDEAECRALAGAELSATRYAAVFVESGGNPFYALQLARASQAPAHSSSADRMASDSGVPRAVAAVLLDELGALSPSARRLLDAGAIAGDPFEPELAYEIAGLEPDAGVAALDELLDTRLLLPTTVPRRFAFRHPLVRRAVYESARGGSRLRGHARAASALQARGAAPATRARHVEQSAAQGDAAAVAVLLEAATAANAHAPAAAARWFEAALRLQPEEDAPARLRTLTGLAQALRSTGDLERCAARLTEALALVEASDVRTRVRLTAACAASEHFLGRHEAADRRLAAALDSLPDRESPEAVTVLLALIAGAFFALDVDAGRALSEQALAIARKLGDRQLIGATAAALAHACANAGDVPGARAAIAEAAPLLDAAEDESVARQLDAINRLAWSEHLIECDEDAIRHAARGIAVARATGQDQFVPMLSAAQALSEARRGRLATAMALQDDALETAEVAANGYVTCWVLTTTAHVAMAQGDHQRARRDAERAVALVEGLESRIATMARVRLSVTSRAQGEQPEGLEALLDAIPPSWAAGYAESLTAIELERERIDAAEPFAARAEAAAAQLDLPLACLLARRARAAILLARGDAPAALALVSDAPAAALAVGSDAPAALALASDASAAPLEAARSEALAGRALAASGERAAAVRALRSAERAFDVCGAERDRDLARRELRRLGARAEPRGPSARGDSGLASLSRREREIADLITARKTNREIAAELFLSEKTIESHLRNVFAKLGASSRVEVARAVERDVRP